MWERIRVALREWYIVAIGFCFIGGGLFLAAQQQSPSAAPSDVQQAGAQQADAQQADKPSGAGTAAQPPQPIARSANPPAKADQTPSTAQPTVEVHEAQPPPPPADNNKMVHDVVAANTQAGASPAAAPTGAGDAAAGRLVFRKCQACHSMEPGKVMLGPSLAGILGRKAGSEAGYSYSPAMKQANIVWDEKTLDAYLTDPQKVVPGNKMPFPGLKTDTDRADVIAFFTASATGGQPAAAAPSGAPPATNQTSQTSPNHCKPRLPPPSSTFRTRIIRCVPASLRAAWSISALAARSTARSIRF